MSTFLHDLDAPDTALMGFMEVHPYGVATVSTYLHDYGTPDPGTLMAARQA